MTADKCFRYGCCCNFWSFTHLQAVSTEDLYNLHTFNVTEKWNMVTISPFLFLELRCWSAKHDDSWTVKLTFDLLDIKCHHSTSFYPIRHLCETLSWLVITALKCVLWGHAQREWDGPWPLKSNQFIPESRWMSVPNLKKLPRGVPEISCSERWHRWTNNPKTSHVQARAEA